MQQKIKYILKSHIIMSCVWIHHTRGLLGEHNKQWKISHTFGALLVEHGCCVIIMSWKRAKNEIVKSIKAPFYWNLSIREAFNAIRSSQFTHLNDCYRFTCRYWISFFCCCYFVYRFYLYSFFCIHAIHHLICVNNHSHYFFYTLSLSHFLVSNGGRRM